MKKATNQMPNKKTLINFTQYISRHTEKKLSGKNWVKKIWAAIEQEKNEKKENKARLLLLLSSS